MKIMFCKLRGWSVIRLMVAAQYKIIEHFKQDKGSKTCASFPQLNSRNHHHHHPNCIILIYYHAKCGDCSFKIGRVMAI